MNVEMVAIDSISPWEHNPRAITEEALVGLIESIKTFGMPQPVVANKRNRRIVGGHQRHKAAKKLEWKEVPVIWVDLDDQQEMALNATLNNPNISGHFTPEINRVIEMIRQDYEPSRFGALRLEEMQMQGSWTSDISHVDETNEASVGVIRVKHPHQVKEAVLEAVKAAVSSFEGVTVET